MKTTTYILSALALFGLAACGQPDASGAEQAPADVPATDHDEEDHEHDEVSLGSAQIGDLTVEFAQGHGLVEAGKEGHLVVKLPYSDSGATIVRAWIGTSDRTQSLVGKGDYAASHDDYDVHAEAPTPLPDGVQWWVEIEKPDGAKQVGSVQPILE